MLVGETVGCVYLRDTDRGVPWLGIAVAERMTNARAQTMYERCGFAHPGIYGPSGEKLYVKRL